MTSNPFPTFHPLNAAQIEAAVSHFLTLLTVNASPELVQAALQEQLDNWRGVLARVESFREWELQRFGVASTDRASEPLPDWSKAALGIPLHVDARMRKKRPTLAELLKRNADDCDDDPRDCPCDWHVFRRETEAEAEEREIPPRLRPFTEQEIKTAAMEYCRTLPGFESYVGLIDGERLEPVPKRELVLQPAQVGRVSRMLHELAASVPLSAVHLEVQPSAYAGAVFVRCTSGDISEHIWVDANNLDLPQVLRMFVARCAVKTGAFDEEQAHRFSDSPLAANVTFTTPERVKLARLHSLVRSELSTRPPPAPVERRRTLASIVDRCTVGGTLLELVAMQLWARDRRGIEIKLREVIDEDLLDHLEGKPAWVVDFKLDSGALISNGNPERWWIAFVELAARVERLEDARGVLLHEDLGRHPPDPHTGQELSTERGQDEAFGDAERRAPESLAGGLERAGTPEAPSPTERSRGQGGYAPGEATGQGSAGGAAGGVS